MNSPSEASCVQRHYTRFDLADRIFEALRQSGADLDALTLDDLGPIDEFHMRGRAATTELAELGALSPGTRVLDVGSGIGGPSRVLAARYGCRVTGIDLVGEYCQVAKMLALRACPDQWVRYPQGSALDLPFADGTFDVIWTQHASMNIEDKPRLYGEMFRVVRPGGRLLLYDIVAGPGGPIHFPVPWARDPAISFLTTAERLQDELRAAGFSVTTWQDLTEPAREWFRKMRARPLGPAPPPSAPSILLGSEWETMTGNMGTNFEEHRAGVVRAVLARPARERRLETGVGRSVRVAPSSVDALSEKA